MRKGAMAADTREHIKKLHSITSKQRGPTRLRLELEFDDASISLNSETGVELTNQLMRHTFVMGMKARYE
jgi:hypothetical protein